jgi:choline dehydrogenase-like flavoprotein
MTQEMRKFSPGEAVDFAIIGSGAAGGVLAKEISTAGFRVVVLEQGPYLHEEDFQHNEYKGCGQRGLGASHLKNPRAALKTKSPAMTAASIFVQGCLEGDRGFEHPGNPRPEFG